MKSWKRQLNDEFDLAAPKLSDEVKNAPILAVQEKNVSKHNEAVLIKKRIKIGSLCAAIAATILVSFLGIFGVFNAKSTTKYMFTLEINPAVVFVTDKDGRVESVKSLNQDADLILSDQSDFKKIKNAPLKEAIVVYTDSAAKLGFLNLSSSGDAVRLSSYDEIDRNLFTEVSNSLSSYFCEKGIYTVVVENILPLQDFCTRVGIQNTNSISDLVSSLNNISDLYGNRISENSDLEDINKLYNSYIVGNELLEIVKNELLDNVYNVVLNAQMLSNIATLNFQIMAQGYLDYWNIKNQNLSGDLLQLVESMETALNEYETKFHREINSFEELLSAMEIYSEYSISNLESIIKTLSSEKFALEATNFVGMLDNIGYDVTSFKSLLTAPQSINQYLEKANLVMTLLKDTRLKQYFDEYSEERTEISEKDYSNFVSRIERQYGSLDNFWNEK